MSGPTEGSSNLSKIVNYDTGSNRPARPVRPQASPPSSRIQARAVIRPQRALPLPPAPKEAPTNDPNRKIAGKNPPPTKMSNVVRRGSDATRPIVQEPRTTPSPLIQQESKYRGQWGFTGPGNLHRPQGPLPAIPSTPTKSTAPSNAVSRLNRPPAKPLPKTPRETNRIEVGSVKKRGSFIEAGAQQEIEKNLAQMTHNLAEINKTFTDYSSSTHVLANRLLNLKSELEKPGSNVLKSGEKLLPSTVAGYYEKTADLGHNLDIFSKSIALVVENAKQDYQQYLDQVKENYIEKQKKAGKDVKNINVSQVPLTYADVEKLNKILSDAMSDINNLFEGEVGKKIKDQMPAMIHAASTLMNMTGISDRFEQDKLNEEFKDNLMARPTFVSGSNITNSYQRVFHLFNQMASDFQKNKGKVEEHVLYRGHQQAPIYADTTAVNEGAEKTKIINKDRGIGEDIEKVDLFSKTLTSFISNSKKKGKITSKEFFNLSNNFFQNEIPQYTKVILRLNEGKKDNEYSTDGLQQIINKPFKENVSELSRVYYKRLFHVTFTKILDIKPLGARIEKFKELEKSLANLEYYINLSSNVTTNDRKLIAEGKAKLQKHRAIINKEIAANNKKRNVTFAAL